MVEGRKESIVGDKRKEKKVKERRNSYRISKAGKRKLQ